MKIALIGYGAMGPFIEMQSETRRKKREFVFPKFTLFFRFYSNRVAVVVEQPEKTKVPFGK